MNVTQKEGPKLYIFGIKPMTIFCMVHCQCKDLPLMTRLIDLSLTLYQHLRLY